ncbi:N-acetylglucosaminyldiphosphodolichol N-acetylglucosaminyltransferase catalytic subunit alg13 [Vermiconidia calcicola]|uniref:N-acetylglucosaminyldiphosphodolichol N-acetylglucosaminyltransferase catalytic subunit alg13 n=1 Tax=Vermiconidia calcicola TaxID=1690605 RepID=A0ACC3MCI6_9PEZI|nr:N-acetylglucosaminyldiphosphodolichol N-acetylglucosaminyltransferase catalytic subunit alg13 [Vermiconidia calcicola]
MSGQGKQKTCFVTIGATASFTGLIKAVLAPDFCKALETQDYTHLLVQYGQDGKQLFEQCLQQSQQVGNLSSLQIGGFALDPSGLRQYMIQAKGQHTKPPAAEVLDALRVSIPLIVVPNSTLLDNHQVELAEALEEQEYVVHGQLENLVGALKRAEQLRTRMKSWPPVNSGTHRQAKGLKGVMDEEMGYLD